MPGAQRVAALDHEAGDHPVEDRPVVEAVAALLPGAGVDPLALALGQLGEVGDRLGRVVGEELHLDVAAVGLQGGVELLGHGASSRPRAGAAVGAARLHADLRGSAHPRTLAHRVPPAGGLRFR